MSTVARHQSLHADRSRVIAAVMGSFLAILIVDFLTHAVVLRPWWDTTGAYWRSPNELFKFIPYAYVSFLLYAAGLTWLIPTLQGRRPRLLAAVAIGAIAGALVGLANILAIYSVLPVPASALLVFPVSFAVDLAAAGASTACILAAERPWRALALLFVLSLALFAVGVVLQNVFFPITRSRAPAASRVGRGGRRAAVRSARVGPIEERRGVL